MVVTVSFGWDSVWLIWWKHANDSVLEHASFDYFETNEGKNISDTIGSIVKCTYLRGMLKQEQGIHWVKDIVSVIKSDLKTKTKKFTYSFVEEFGTTDRASPVEINAPSMI